MTARLVINLQILKVPSQCLQIRAKCKVKAKNKGLFDNVKLKEQTNDILNDLNKDYREKYKTTFTKQAKEIRGIPNPKSIAHTIKENIKFKMEETCF